jgi:peptidoglycan/xylan/chitin deacetylase (PgdA/CDA1 family)
MKVYNGTKTKYFILKLVIIIMLIIIVLSGYSLTGIPLSTIQGYSAEYKVNESLPLDELPNEALNELLNEPKVNFQMDCGIGMSNNMNNDHKSNILDTNTENMVNPKTEKIEKTEEEKYNNQIQEKEEFSDEIYKVSDAQLLKQEEDNNGIEKENNNQLAIQEEDNDTLQLQKENNNKVVKLTSKSVFNGSKEKKQVALTFDDGPDAHFTLEILDILKENDVSATFFVLGCNAEKYPKVLKRIKDEEHDIGNHSWSHKSFKKLSEEQIKNEIKETEKIIESVNESYLPLFRLPYGASNEKVGKMIHSLGYYDVRWSVDTEDWSGITPSEIMKRVEKQLYPGGIILMHCSGRRQSIENSVKTLPEIIKYVKGKGYEFVTISQLLET